MKPCPRCGRLIAREARLCRSCIDQLGAMGRESLPRAVGLAVLEAESEGLDVVALVFETLRARRGAWRALREAEDAEHVRRHGATWAARLIVEARARGERLTAREAGARYGLRAGTVRQALTRLKRHASEKSATSTSAKLEAAPS